MQILESAYTWAYKPGYRSETRYIILHHAAGTGSAEAIHAYHRDTLGWCGIAYHYYVRTDGRVYRGRPENWKGGHTSGYNDVSIGVCFEGNFETDVMPDAQLAAGRALVLDILTRYPAALVKAHRDLGVTACPGKNFPFAEITRARSEADPNTWAAESCAKAVARGVFLGDGHGDFKWHDSLTRQEFAVLLDRLGLLDTKR